ncbi:MAG: HAMP domain-containing sensor histidine kinase [Candidatus Cloacimonadota bacterium]|nr:HAMP domain-containing sensor histidine kinase [Candidatus Cloacimonadota bacterium]
MLKRLRNKQTIIKSYFVIGLIFIPIFFIIYTNMLLKKSHDQAKIIPELVSKHFVYSSQNNYEQLLSQYVFDNIVKNIKYPIIITDSNKKPIFWKNIDIPEIYFDELNIAEQDELSKIKKQMEKNGIIPLNYEGSKNAIGYTYFAESRIVKQLRIIPYLEMGLIILFILFGFYGLNLLKKNEKNKLWVGLAKETAHQFGTPITSIIGWIEYIELKLGEQNMDSEILDMLDEMKTDVDKLKLAANRFGKVGSDVKLAKANIEKLVSDLVEYFSHRLPKNENKISISFINKLTNTDLFIDSELIGWSLENIVRNAIDSMKMGGGNIILTAYNSDNGIYILVKDQGIGISKSNQKKLFQPGFTTKKRGWGLGLSLSKRIIEEFHNGKITIAESIKDEGTTIEVLLPTKTKRGK